jgi:hypothetical protein
VRIEPNDDVALTLQRTPTSIALHLIRYGFDEVRDRVRVLHELRNAVRMPEAIISARGISPDGPMTASMPRAGSGCERLPRNVPRPGIVLFGS